MAYVDLSPVRAGLANNPETPSYTSIQERIRPVFDLEYAIKNKSQCGDLLDFKSPLPPLLHFEKGLLNLDQAGNFFAFKNYLELVDWTGRIIRNDKRGYIGNDSPPVLRRLHISQEQLQLNTTRFEAIHASRFNRSTSKSDTGKFCFQSFYVI